MSIIVPAILPTSKEDLEEKLGRLVGIATEVQVDIVDGLYATPATWPYVHDNGAFNADSVLPHLDDMHVELDLMVCKPEEVTGSWIEAGATRILVHATSTDHLPNLVTDFKMKYGHAKGFSASFLSFGLAITLDTKLEVLDPYIDDIDYVQFMGIKTIGRQGEPFATEVLERINVFRHRHPGVPIQVDGGVNMESAPLLLEAGVSRLVVGSALWRAPNLLEAYAQFVELTESHGIFE